MMYILIFFNTIFIFNCCISAEIEPAINDDRVNDPFQGLTTFSPKLDKKTNDTFMILNDPANYEMVINQLFECSLSSDKDIVPKIDKLNSVERLGTISRCENVGLRLFNKDLIKRSAVYGNGDRKKNIPKRKQKKVKLLGRLLMNNKNDGVTQDDYDEENNEDDFNKPRKTNRENFQNEDDPSIMELIAFNRRKTNMNRNRKIDKS